MLKIVAISYTIQKGDCTLSIAAAHGVAWAKIWDDPANKALRNTRKSANILHEGDVLSIPLVTKTVSVATGTLHKIVITMERLTLRLRLHTVWGEPRKELPFVFRHNGITLASGESDAEGICEGEVPAHVRRIQFVVTGRFGEEVNQIDIGHLDPVDLDSGVQHRLDNLGFSTTEGDEWDEPSTAALTRFQQQQKLEVSGVVDDATRSKITEVHGS